MWKQLSAAACGLALLGACASQPQLSEEHCASVDWGALGFSDGQAGQAMTVINDEITACRAGGIEPDMDAYNAGRAAGLAQFCHPVNVLDAALRGEDDPMVCEPLNETQRAALEQGRETRAAAQRWQQLQGGHQELLERRDAIDQEGAHLSEAFNAETEAQARLELAQRITQLTQERNAVDAEIAKASPIMRQEEARYQVAVRAYERYRAALAGS